MTRLTSLAVVLLGGALVAAPVPPDAKSLVAGLSDPDEKARDAASAALKDRADALPWLRRAARSRDPITAARGAKLLASHEKMRQAVVAKAIDACIRDGRIDLFMEWHHYWQPENKDDLWPVGPRAAKAGMDLYAKSCPPETTKYLEQRIIPAGKRDVQYYDGPAVQRPKVKGQGLWYTRTDRWWGGSSTAFAFVDGPVHTPYGSTSGGHYFVLGSFQIDRPHTTFIACDGEVLGGADEIGGTYGVRAGLCVIVCRGNFRGNTVGSSVVLVDGDVDLESGGKEVQGSLIRASGEIRLRPNAAPPVNCTIEAHAKDATAPYKFFELADVGLSLADDEEGLVVTAVKGDTPFGNCGLAKGDLIRAIDDVPAASPEDFRKHIRRALVRQGDCLVTVVRDGKTLDLPVFFPLPK